MSKRPEKKRFQGWLTAFLLVPAGVWLAAVWRTGFREKTLSNLSLEPLAIVLFSLVVFFGWYLTARRGLRPFVGITLLILLSAAALAVHRYVPSLRE